MNNVADKYPKVLNELKEKMDIWNSTLPTEYVKKPRN
jgi:hypothetical protein